MSKAAYLSSPGARAVSAVVQDSQAGAAGRAPVGAWVVQTVMFAHCAGGALRWAGSAARWSLIASCSASAGCRPRAASSVTCARIRADVVSLSTRDCPPSTARASPSRHAVGSPRGSSPALTVMSLAQHDPRTTVCGQRMSLASCADSFPPPAKLM